MIAGTSGFKSEAYLLVINRQNKKKEIDRVHSTHKNGVTAVSLRVDQKLNRIDVHVTLLIAYIRISEYVSSTQHLILCGFFSKCLLLSTATHCITCNYIHYNEWGNGQVIYLRTASILKNLFARQRKMA